MQMTDVNGVGRACTGKTDSRDSAAERRRVSGGRSVTLFVPYIASSTNVGTRQHWTARKREVDACHLLVRNAVRRAGIERITVPVDLTFRPRLGKGVRRRDTSNYSISLKNLEDGLVAAGVLPDDRCEYVRRVILEPPVVDRKADTGTWVQISLAQS